MKLNQTILEFISILENNCKNDQHLSSSKQATILYNANKPLVEINQDSILLLGKEDVSEKILTIPQKKISNHVDLKGFEKFCSSINIVRFNHLGIQYSCPNISREVEYYKNLLVGTSFKLYEEPSDDTFSRWFFIGNLDNWKNPLFELVITDKIHPLVNDWFPHFQIDIDTKQSVNELKKLAKKHLKPNFFSWELDLPGYGVVLTMGQLGNINGVKIYIGIGTNSRDTKYQRTELLVEV